MANQDKIKDIFDGSFIESRGVLIVSDLSLLERQSQTNDVFSDKCFWNDELGVETSISANYDWYAPSNAERYSKDQFMKMVRKAGLIERDFHSEEACHSGRFTKG